MDLQAGHAPDENSAFLYYHFQPRLVSFFKRRGLPEDSSEELAQDVLVKLFKNITNFRFEASIEIWVFAIASNTWRNALRASARLRPPGDEVPLYDIFEEDRREGLISSSSVQPLILRDTLSTVLDRERDAFIREGIVKLPAAWRRCVELRYGRDLPIVEVARLLELPEAVVQSHLSDARLKLADIAREWDIGAADEVPLSDSTLLGELDERAADEVNPVVANLIQVCDSELLAWLARHPEDLEKVHPGTFEQIVAEILHSEGFEVETVSSWNQADGGVDLLAAKRVSHGMDIRLAIQCKRFKRERRVSAEPIRCLVGVLDRFRVHAGVVATTSSFSKEAEQEACQHFWRISLRDFESITSSLRSTSGFHLQANGLWTAQ